MGKQLQYQWANVYHHPKYAVAGAKAAGVHPLYYLGNTPTWSPTIGGQSDSGSAIGSGIGEALGGAAGAYLGRGERARQRNMETRNFESQQAESLSRTAANFAQAQYYSSLGKRTEQHANIRQDGIETNPSSQTITTPGGTWETSPTTPQQEVEDQYGGVVGEGYGIWRAIYDAMRQAGFGMRFEPGSRSVGFRGVPPKLPRTTTRRYSAKTYPYKPGGR